MAQSEPRTSITIVVPAGRPRRYEVLVATLNDVPVEAVWLPVDEEGMPL